MDAEKEKNNDPLGGMRRHRYGVKLGNAQDCRRLLSKQVNAVLKGECSQETLRVVSYAVSVLLKTFEQSEFAEKLKNLEKILGGEGNENLIP